MFIKWSLNIALEFLEAEPEEQENMEGYQSTLINVVSSMKVVNVYYVT